MVTVGDWLVILWAVLTGVVLFVGLARALDTPPSRRRRPRPASRLLEERVRASTAEGGAPAVPAASTDVAAGDRVPSPSPVPERPRDVDPRAAWGRLAARPVEPENPDLDRARADARAAVFPVDPSRGGEAARVAEPPADRPSESGWRRALPAPDSAPREVPRAAVRSAEPGAAVQPTSISEPEPPAAPAGEAFPEWRQPSLQVTESRRERGEAALVGGEPAAAPAEMPVRAEPLPDAGIGTAAATGGPHGAGEELRGTGDDAVLRCLELEEAGFHDGLVALAARSVTEAPVPSEGVAVPAALPALDRAALLSLLMRGRVALGDGAGAAEALRAFQGVGVDLDEPHTAQRLRDIGGRVGRRLLQGAESATVGSEESVRSLEVALRWLEWAQRAGPEDGDVSALAAHARHALAAGRERRIEDLVERKEFGEALRQLAPALAAGGLGDERRQALGELLWASLTGETGRLTGQALHGPGGRKALGAMREAERLVRSPVVRKLSRERRHDLDRRMRWAYLTLGISRMEAGDLPGSLEPLARAVGMVAPRGAALHGDPPALAAAVEALVSRWSERILGLARDGDRGAAMSEARGLSRLIDAAFAYGLTADDLRSATERRQALMLEIAEEPAP